MAQCVTQATLTSHVVTAQETQSTSFSASQITASPTTTTITTTSTSCSAQSSGSSVCQTSVGTSVNVIPGGVTTTQVPVVVTNTVTVTTDTTLFTTSCQQQQSSTPQSDTNSSSTPPPSVSTPPPTVVTSASSSTAANGVVVVSSFVVTSTPPPSTYTTPPNPTLNSGDQPKKSTANVGAIVGGVFGGIAGLAVIIGLVWFFLRRRKRWDSVFDNDYQDYMAKTGPPRLTLEDESYDDGPTNNEPKPYQYGLVGGPTPSPPAHTPPGSPPSASRLESLAYSAPMLRSSHGHQSSLSGSASLASTPMANAPSEGYFPNIPPAMVGASQFGQRLSPQPQRSPRSPTPSNASAVSGLAPLPAGAALPSTVAGRSPKRESTDSTASGSIKDYPLHRGVLQVANGEIPMSPMTPVQAGSSSQQRSSTLQLDVGDTSLNAEDLMSSVHAGSSNGNTSGSSSTGQQRPASSASTQRPGSVGGRYSTANVETRDGKGRVTLSAKPVKVHTDGGRAPPGYSE